MFTHPPACCYEDRNFSMTQHMNATTGQRLISIFTALQVSLNMACTLFFAGWPANGLMSAIYKAPCRALALSLPRMALSSGCGCCRLFSYASYRYSTACRGRSGREPCRTSEFFNFLPLSRVVARQLGLLAQVRYPARGSARVTPLKHNVK